MTACTAATRDPRLIGSWRLLRYVDTPIGSKPVYAFGRQPRGLFVFTADGSASVSIMGTPSTLVATAVDPDPDACIPAWYCSYFGTYTSDRKHSVYTIHVRGSNIPSFLQTDQTRGYAIHGDRLVLSGSYLAGKTHVHYERVLERE